MKLKNVLNPFGITMEDFKNPAFQEGMVGSLLWYSIAAAIGWGVAYMLFA
jgi:ABC-type polysaccharide/polyol phosphate export permease